MVPIRLAIVDGGFKLSFFSSIFTSLGSKIVVAAFSHLFRAARGQSLSPQPGHAMAALGTFWYFFSHRPPPNFE
jgi:hypothetical protein